MSAISVDHIAVVAASAISSSPNESMAVKPSANEVIRGSSFFSNAKRCMSPKDFLTHSISPNL